jgi:hypothetical protein
MLPLNPAKKYKWVHKEPGQDTWIIYEPISFDRERITSFELLIDRKEEAEIICDDGGPYTIEHIILGDCIMEYFMAESWQTDMLIFRPE